MFTVAIGFANTIYIFPEQGEAEGTGFFSLEKKRFHRDLIAAPSAQKEVTGRTVPGSVLRCRAGEGETVVIS